MTVERQSPPPRPILGEALRLGVPAVMGMLSHWVLSIADEYMVSRLAIGATPERGYRAIGNVHVASIYVLALVITFNALAVGTQAVAARRWGEGRRDAASGVLRTALVMVLALSALLTPLYIAFAGEMVRLFTGETPSIDRDIVTAYLEIRFWALPAMMAIYVLSGWFAGVGNTVIVMMTALLVNAVNILLNWVLIEGRWGFPRLEERGAALASTIGTHAGLAFMIAYALMSRRFRALNLLRRWRPEREVAGRILRLSAPSFLHYAAVHGGFMVFLAAIIPNTREGAVGVAASAIVWVSTALAFMIAFGFGNAAATLMGQSLGAGDPARARHSVWVCAWVSLAATLPVTLTCALAGPWITSLFTQDPEVIRVSRWLFLIIASFQLLDNFGIILAEAFKGAGLNFFVMVVEVPLNLVLFLSLSWWWGVGLNWGVAGAWGAMIPYVLIFDAVMITAFQRGVWRRGQA
ncbi:MAG: MATE family efflux transporter [Candidatus Sumerlaeia bacterium]|nr:MATE family efflux transporter [Candidatus Sumerlaeia bacterium]